MSAVSSFPDNTGILICGHGSRAKIAEQEFGLLAARLRDRFPDLLIEYGFLEYSSPNIHMALDRLISNGARRICALPGMLFRATHAQNDIPSVLTTYMDRHPGLDIRYGVELGLHPEMIRAFETRILEAVGLESIPRPGVLYDTMLVVVGRGTSVATANAEAAKLTRIVAEDLGFGWCETVYSGVTFPSVGRGLDMAVRLGFSRIVVAPYFLFSGRLVGRIHAYVNQAANTYPHVQFMLADYLRDQGHVINAFVARIEEVLSRTRQEPGLLEDFQTRLAAGKVAVHHHHAEYQPGHGPVPDSAHNHHHAPYRHIAHPHGPRTMIDENVCCCFMGQFPQTVIDEERQQRLQSTRLPADGRTPQCK